MKVIYHRLAVRDVRQILDYYEKEAGPRLADRFFQDLLALLGQALANSDYFPPFGAMMRRANLAGFPYHVLYEPRPWGIKVVVVRHHRRSPQYGLRRR